MILILITDKYIIFNSNQFFLYIVLLLYTYGSQTYFSSIYKINIDVIYFFDTKILRNDLISNKDFNFNVKKIKTNLLSFCISSL